MASFSFSNIALRALAASVPANIKQLDISKRRVEHYAQQIGVEQVHISFTEQTAVELGYVALQQALAKAQWQAKDLDMLIFDSQTPDYLGGVGNSSLLHHYLNLPEKCAVFDITVGCPAVPYSLAIACSLLSNSSTNQRIAIIIGDNHWPYYTNKEAIDAKPTVLFGEGTIALLLEKVISDANEKVPPIKVQLFSNGGGYKSLLILLGTKNAWRKSDKYEMPDGGTIELQGAHYGFYMDGLAIDDLVSNKVKDSILQMYPQNLAESFDYFAFHQANQQLLNRLGESLGLRKEQVLRSLRLYGNTSGASPLLTICANLSELKKEARIFNASYGIGLAWGFSEFVLPPNITCPIVTTDLRFDEHFLKPIS